MSTNLELYCQNFPQAIFELDQDGYIRYSNPAAVTLTGFSSAELFRQYLSIFRDEDDGTKIDYELGVARQKGRFESEGWLTRKDRSRFWGLMILAPVHNEQGEFYGYSALLLDNSDKKRTELDLRKEEERSRLIIDGIKEYGIFMLDPEGYILTWNDGARIIIGYAPYEIIGKHFSIFYTAEDIKEDKPARELQTAVAEGKFEEEGWRIKKNGFVFWADVVLTPLYNDQNKLIGFSKVTRDLTERKANEERLGQSEERYRIFVEQVTDYAIFMLDEKGRIASWNEGAHRIKGYEAKEIIGKHFSVFYMEEDIISGKPAHELKVAYTEGKYEEEGWRIRKDGTKFWANVVITPVVNRENKLVGYSKVTRDLTERKAGERALRESFEKYRSLAEELSIANIQLTYANQELEQFNSIVSHDLQEPVRTVKSFLQLVDMKLGKVPDADLRIYIGKVNTAAERMKELIQNLLQYSQLNKTDVARTEIPVLALFEEVLQNMKSIVEDSKAEINVGSEVDTIHGDRVQLGQLLQNLVGNALKFNESDKPQIRINCIRENGHVKMSVSDNGIGIAKEDTEKVFEIFRRLNTRNKYPGTGIGLAICKKIVERHQGSIWPESKPGAGTRFHFTLAEPKHTES